MNTHKARRTFGSTVTLGHVVAIHVVKEMLGHHSIKQTEEYALIEEESIKTEMQILKGKLEGHTLTISVFFRLIGYESNLSTH